MKEQHEYKETITMLKKGYESVEVPPELSDLVQETIAKATQDLQNGVDKKDSTEPTLQKENPPDLSAAKQKKWIRGLTTAVAAFAVLVGAFAFGVNTNEAFAASLKDVPILGALADVFTGSVIKESDDVADVEALIPEVRGLKDKKLQEMINKKVTDKTTAAIKETKQAMVENKEAWLATGGTEEEYMQREITVDYEVKCITEDILSFTVSKTQTLASAYFEIDYYNYDLKTGKELTLEAALQKSLGDQALKKASKIIAQEITKRSKEVDAVYFDGSEGVEGFTKLSKDQNFYINENGNPVVVFNKYEIAPGYMGIQEFEIKK